MSARLTREAIAAFVLLLAAAVYFVLVELHRPNVSPALDIYIYFLPNKLHALYSVLDGGKGLLWNPYQACGEPFLANPATSLFYPPHLLFLVLEANTAVHAVLIINMVIGAVGMLLLARELGLSRVAAVGGALAFELGDPMSQLTGWSPMQNGPWAWMPWALLFCERLLRAPSLAGVIGLAVVLALELAPGWVVIAALTYQLIGLRLCWELVTRRDQRPWRALLAVLCGLAVTPLLLAVQLIPAAEMAGGSFRVNIEVRDFVKYGSMFMDIAASLRRRIPPVPFTVALLLLAGLAPVIAARRRTAIFYLLVGGVYGVLALGARTPLFSLYLMLPPGPATLRYPHRLFWVSGFSLVMLSALALDAMTKRARLPPLALVVTVILAAALFGLVPGGLRWSEAVVVTGVGAAVLAATMRPGLGTPAAWVVVGLIALNLVAVPLRYGGRLMPSAEALWRHSETFAAIKSQMTAQDRFFLIPKTSGLLDFSFFHKVATIFRVPEIYDYEPLLGPRLFRYYTMLWHGEVLGGLDTFEDASVRGGFRSRLLDLTAARYVITSAGFKVANWGIDLLRVPVAGGLDVYASNSALPRARYVPRIEVIREPSMLLNRLAYERDDLAEVAFVEEPLASGFTGEAASPRAGAARFLHDDPEHLVIEVEAPARGFLHLADTHYPGWKATVNGAVVPIVQANYMFRLIEVPAGTSRVEFRYRPASVTIGATISAVTLGVLAIVFVRYRRRGAVFGARRDRHGPAEHP